MVGSAAVGWVGLLAARHDPTHDGAPFSPALAGLAVLAALPLWWRRTRPLGMFLAATAAIVTAGAVDERGLPAAQVVLEALVLCFAIGAWSTRRGWAVALVGGSGTLVVLGAAGDGASVPAAAAYAGAGLVLPAAVGYATRTRRLYLEEVEQRLLEAERDRDARARQAVLEERNRMARELHDVVAHHVSLIGVQAGAARMSLDHAPDRVRDALEAIDESSRAAIGEMRQLLDVLAPLDGGVGPAAALAPSPGLTDLERLLDRWRGAGLAVETEVIGDPALLAPTVALCAYRVVEEAVTNVARHSPHRSVAVRLIVGEEAVSVEVSDPAPGHEPGRAGSSPVAAPMVEPPGSGSGEGAGAGSGRGLLGMRERVALAGGTLRAGPCGAGFRVDVTIPRHPT